MSIYSVQVTLTKCRDGWSGQALVRVAGVVVRAEEAEGPTRGAVWADLSAWLATVREITERAP